MNKEITNIDLVEGGNVVKQGDYFTIGYRPRNAKGEAVDLTGKAIAVEIFNKDGIAFESTGEFDSGDGLIYVHVNKNIGYGNMFIEFTVTDPNDAGYRLKFPTNNNAGRLTIHRSTDDLEYVGVKMVTVEQLKADQRTFEQTVDGKVETLKQRVDTGIGAFTSSTEILDARGGEVNLRARLDKTTAQLADKIAIDIFNPPAPLDAVKGDGSDILGDTNRFQTILNYAIQNGHDVFVQRDLTLEPITREDGTKVCILLNDGENQGTYRKKMKLYARQGVKINTNNTTEPHTIFRWKLGDSKLDGFHFIGTREYTTALEVSRINLKDVNEFDGSNRNRFSNLRFETCKIGFSLEGSAYYNYVDNITFLQTDLCLWLKKTYALINELKEFDSGVNRNNFYSISAFGCKDGILLDYGDTNKFYSCSFEWLTGTAVQVYDYTQEGLHHTAYNTFYGVTNESNLFNLIHNSYHNSFIDFESAFSKVNFITKPLVYIPSGDPANSHTILNNSIQTVDQDFLEFLKNRSYDTSGGHYVSDIADYSQTKDSDGRYKLYNWRNFNFSAEQCVNVASRTFNSSSKQAVFKSLGGLVTYIAKLSITPKNALAQIRIPLPELMPDGDLYSFANNVQAVVPIGYRKDGGAPAIVPAIIEDNYLTIPVPNGNWSTDTGTSANVLTINLQYARAITVIDSN